MIATIIICAITFVAMIMSILFLPKIKIGKIMLSTYWIITLLGLGALLSFGLCNVKTLFESLTQDSAINPIKILILFLSMTSLSIFLDEVGLFKYLAIRTLNKANSSQKKLFLYLYLIVSILTIFTSNDIVILSFTPFICYFAKNAKINPIPYLFAEFVGANTWSMALIIGNPTNIYIASAYSISFIEYLSVMIIPTFCAGITSFIILYLLFFKQLSKPFYKENNEVRKQALLLIKDKFLLTIGIIVLCVCTILLAISSYIGLEMWIVSFISIITLFIIAVIYSIVKKRKPNELISSLKRAPWELIPFVLSMFCIIVVLNEQEVTIKIASVLGNKNSNFIYGITSCLSCNIINNIPMSVLFCSIIEKASTSISAVYATIIGSNLGAILTPIGALAGIMWSSILNEHGLKFNYADFVKHGVIICLPTLVVALSVLLLFI